MQLNILPIFLILILLAIGAFGFLVFESMSHSENHTCPIPIFSGSSCPIVSSLSLTFHHLSGLQNFSQSTINISLSVFILFSVIFVFFLLVKLLRQVQSNSIFSYQKHQEFLNFTIKQTRQFIRWFVIRNRKNPYALNWAYESLLIKT